MAPTGGTLGSTLMRLLVDGLFVDFEGLPTLGATPFARALLVDEAPGEEAEATARTAGEDSEALAERVEGGIVVDAGGVRRRRSSLPCLAGYNDR